MSQTREMENEDMNFYAEKKRSLIGRGDAENKDMTFAESLFDLQARVQQNVIMFNVVYVSDLSK